MHETVSPNSVLKFLYLQFDELSTYCYCSLQIFHFNKLQIIKCNKLLNLGEKKAKVHKNFDPGKYINVLTNYYTRMII